MSAPVDQVVISDDESNDGIDECQRDITPKLDGGVLKQIVQGGKYEGKIYKGLGDEVLIHVVGTLKEKNKIFYNTRKLEKPLRTKLRVGSEEQKNCKLPLALDIAVSTMKKHEIALLTCKPEYCYGAKPYKEKDFLCEVPANSTIVFEVELLDFRFYDLTKHKDSGVLFRKRFRQGDGDFYPTYNSEVCCDISSYDDYKGCQVGFSGFGGFGSVESSDLMFNMFGSTGSSYNGDEFEVRDSILEGGQKYKSFEESFRRNDGMLQVDNQLTLSRTPNVEFLELRDFSWTLGEGELHQIPSGVELAIENMVVGEMAMFFIRYDYMKQMLSPAVYEDAKKHSDFYHFIIHLKSCKRAREYYEMSGEERLSEGRECKLKGNHYLTERRNVRLALKRFKRAIDLLETSIDLDGESEERDQLLFACYLNISKAYFDAKTPELCADYLDKALKMRPTSEKAMYRYGLLLMERKLYTEAKAQFDRMLAIYPTNQIASRLANQCELKALEQSAAERKLCRKMFKSASAEDEVTCG